MMKVSADQIKSAANAVDRVKSLDETITKIGGSIEDMASGHGGQFRGIIGRNLLSQFTDEHLGEVVLCAVINALLNERAEIVGGHDLVEFPPSPCPKQRPQAGL